MPAWPLLDRDADSGVLNGIWGIGRVVGGGGWCGCLPRPPIPAYASP